MNSNLLLRGSLEIPEALTLDHEKLRAELIKAAAEPGEIGTLAECAAQLYLAHFDEEEQCVSRAFGMLHDLASDRAQPNTAEVAWMIAQFTDQHLASRNHHQPINAAIAELLCIARENENKEIVQLVCDLKHHEKIENQMMYPTMLLLNKSVREHLEN